MKKSKRNTENRSNSISKIKVEDLKEVEIE